MSANARGLFTMSAATTAEAEALVTPSGDLVVPSEAVRGLALTPGERVHVTVAATRHRRNMYGVLAGRLRDVSAEEIAEARRDVWGDLADEA
jgi:hypothetical protein